MNWKERIRNLRLPRLLIEAALIFGSVYMALVLEADRSRDFEREILIGELNVLKGELQRDSSIIQYLFIGENSLIRKVLHNDSIILTLIEQNEKWAFDSVIILSEISHEIVPKWGPTYFLEPPTFNKLGEDYYHMLILEDSRKGLWQYFKQRRFQLILHEMVIEYQKNFDLKMDEKYTRFPVRNENESQMLVRSLELKNAILFYKDYADYLTGNGKFLHMILGRLLPVIDKEIQAQEEAMKGIFN